LLPSLRPEADSDQAIALLTAVREGTIDLIQPPHWLAEVAAVLARLSPQTVGDDVADLYAMELPVLDTPDVYLTACELAGTLGQHVFDTLYHAVALETPNTTLVTADERYYRKAAGRGSIVLLNRFTPPGSVAEEQGA
jgi:predicted nucleic acid-binding protein